MTQIQQQPGTALPWRKENSPHVSLENCEYRELITDGEGGPLILGEIYYSDTGDEEAEANARYIVTAANAYPKLLAQRDELVAALEGAIALLDDCEIAHPLKWENALANARQGEEG